MSATNHSPLCSLVVRPRLQPDMKHTFSGAKVTYKPSATSSLQVATTSAPGYLMVSSPPRPTTTTVRLACVPSLRSMWRILDLLLTLVRAGGVVRVVRQKVVTTLCELMPAVCMSVVIRCWLATPRWGVLVFVVLTCAACFFMFPSCRRSGPPSCCCASCRSGSRTTSSRQ